MIDTRILKSEEKAALSLRSLYSRFGYERYKMSKFEEYDLYARNKDFLVSDGIITFTDIGGKLLALKPDVTLSIIKNTRTGASVQRLYYDEKVYRISKDSRSFKEISQTGLECIGDISITDVCQVLFLAQKSLETINKEYILEISHAGLINALFEFFSADEETEEKLLTLIRDKNRDGIRALAESKMISDVISEAVASLINSYKSIDLLSEALAPFSNNEKVREALDELKEIYSCLSELSSKDRLIIDFSIVSDVRYYSGIVFKGYIKNVPSSVLSGGQYDKLMKKMGKKGGAVGFAVYLDMLARTEETAEEFDCDVLLLVSENVSPVEAIKKAQQLSENNIRVITAGSCDSIRYKEIVRLGFGEVEEND